MAKQKSKSNTLPELKTAKRELMIREARAFAWMLVRLVCIALLTTLLIRAVPALQPFRVVFDAIGGILILAPLFTGLGRIFAWRIALGKAYVDAKRFADAEAILVVLSGLRASLFDANSEGRYYRALALRSLGQVVDADLLLTEIVQHGREPWQTRAKEELVQNGAGTIVGSKRPATTS